MLDIAQAFEEAVRKCRKNRRYCSTNKPKKWAILPKKWIIERTIAWLTHSRRRSKDDEITVDAAENMIIISHSATL